MKKAIIAACLLAASVTGAFGQATTVRTTAPSSSLVINGSLVFNSYTVIAPKAGRLMAFSGTSVPADGAVTPDGCWKVSASTTDTTTMTAMGNVPNSVLVVNGLVLVFSDYIDASNPSVNSCYTLHKAAAEFIMVSYG